MWPAFINACRENVAEADDKMVFDRFHIMRHIVEAVDKVRKQEHKALMSEGNNTLVNRKYLWLTNQFNMTDYVKMRFKKLQSSELKTGRAWALKFWKRWYFWATHSRLQAMIDAAKLIARHLPNVLTYFKHRITNAVAEGLNSKIATVKNVPVDSGTGIISKSPSTSIAAGLICTRLMLPMGKSDEPKLLTDFVYEAVLNVLTKVNGEK
jgi:transposase